MATTTIRVDSDTHARLRRLSEASGASLMDTVRSAADALWREQLARQVQEEMSGLRGDPEAWRSYLADEEATAVSDGIA